MYFRTVFRVTPSSVVIRLMLHPRRLSSSIVVTSKAVFMVASYRRRKSVCEQAPNWDPSQRRSATARAGKGPRAPACAREHQPAALPPYSPELNPVKNIWDDLRDNKLGSSVFDTYDTIVDRCCAAWNWLSETRPHPVRRSRALDQNGQNLGRLV